MKRLVVFLAALMLAALAAPAALAQCSPPCGPPASTPVAIEPGNITNVGDPFLPARPNADELARILAMLPKTFNTDDAVTLALANVMEQNKAKKAKLGKLLEAAPAKFPALPRMFGFDPIAMIKAQMAFRFAPARNIQVQTIIGRTLAMINVQRGPTPVLRRELGGIFGKLPDPFAFAAGQVMTNFLIDQKKAMAAQQALYDQQMLDRTNQIIAAMIKATEAARQALLTAGMTPTLTPGPLSPIGPGLGLPIAGPTPKPTPTDLKTLLAGYAFSEGPTKETIGNAIGTPPVDPREALYAEMLKTYASAGMRDAAVAALVASLQKAVLSSTDLPLSKQHSAIDKALKGASDDDASKALTIMADWNSKQAEALAKVTEAQAMSATDEEELLKTRDELLRMTNLIVANLNEVTQNAAKIRP